MYVKQSFIPKYNVIWPTYKRMKKDGRSLAREVIASVKPHTFVVFFTGLVDDSDSEATRDFFVTLCENGNKWPEFRHRTLSYLLASITCGLFSTLFAHGQISPANASYQIDRAVQSVEHLSNTHYDFQRIFRGSMDHMEASHSILCFWLFRACEKLPNEDFSSFYQDEEREITAAASWILAVATLHFAYPIDLFLGINDWMSRHCEETWIYLWKQSSVISSMYKTALNNVQIKEEQITLQAVTSYVQGLPHRSRMQVVNHCL